MANDFQTQMRAAAEAQMRTHRDAKADSLNVEAFVWGATAALSSDLVSDLVLALESCIERLEMQNMPCFYAKEKLQAYADEVKNA